MAKVRILMRGAFGLFAGAVVLGTMVGCEAPPGTHGTPPDGSREELTLSVLAAIDDQSLEGLGTLFPTQPAEELEGVIDACGPIDPRRRVSPPWDEIVPYRFTIYLSGPQRTDDTPVACIISLVWLGTEGPWTISGESIAPSAVPTPDT